uniref:Transthyretin-like family protein n=1 Tax=Strongyloides papillosus TaxID=174720 RepID=A0A0N5BDA6_STREA
MHFKVIVTLLLFTIHAAIEARFRLFRSKAFSVAIKGKLTCPHHRKGFALVMISFNKKPEVDKHPVAKHYAKFDLSFYLSKMFEYRRGYPREYNLKN